MLKLIIWLLVLIFIIGPILWILVVWDINRHNKKIEDHYKMMEAKRKAEYEELEQQAKRDAEIEAKLEKIREEYKATHN